MRKALSEKNLVVVLFVIVLVFFALAQEDTKKIERMYQDSSPSSTSSFNEAPDTEDGINAQEKANVLPGVQVQAR
jgi:hypothetical protein